MCQINTSIFNSSNPRIASKNYTDLRYPSGLYLTRIKISPVLTVCLAQYYQFHYRTEDDWKKWQGALRMDQVPVHNLSGIRQIAGWYTAVFSSFQDQIKEIITCTLALGHCYTWVFLQPTMPSALMTKLKLVLPSRSARILVKPTQRQVQKLQVQHKLLQQLLGFSFWVSCHLGKLVS